jgi:hypothetical protein
MQQNAQVIAIDAEAAADLVLVAFLEEYRAEEVAVARGKRIENGADVQHSFGRDEGALQIDEGIRGLEMALFEGLILVNVAVILAQHVLANGINEGAKALGLTDAIAA